MKVLKQLTLLISLILLQACLPDSFTKFREEPAVKNEEGASGGDPSVCPSGSADPFCLSPSSISYDAEMKFNIDSISLAGEILIEPQVIGVTNPDAFNTFTTYSISPALPSGLGISFDVNTGEFVGVAQAYYVGTHTVTLQYNGNIPVTLVSNLFEISIATTLQPIATIQNPVNKTLVLQVVDATPFIGRTWITAQGQNGSAEIQFLDLISNQIHLSSNLVGTNGRFILRTANELGLDFGTVFASAKTTTEGLIIALNPADDLTVDQGVLSTALYISPLGDSTNINAGEFATLDFSISPALTNGLRFTEQTECYDMSLATPAVAAEAFCTSATPGYQLVPGGTIWGTVNPAANLEPTDYLVTVTNIHGSEATRVVTISILVPAAPKSTSSLAFRQTDGQNLKIRVSNASPFDGRTHVTTSEGKVATLNGVDLSSNHIYVTPDSDDGLYFAPGIALDNQNIFFNQVATVSDSPIFFYDDSPIDNLTNQKFLRVEVSPLDIFEAAGAANLEQERALSFTITPDIELTGLNFQAQSACYDMSSGDQSTFVLQADFTDCDLGTVNFGVIRGGTIWGEISQAYVPLPQTTFTVVARSPNARTVSTQVKIEFTPFIEPSEFSLSQDLLLRLLTTTNFRIGDYISNNSGARGTVKDVFDADGSTFVWINVQQGNFLINTNVDNKFPYINQRGFISDLQPVNARLTTNIEIPVDDSMMDDENVDNIITTADGRARVVYKNATDTFIRMNEGFFSTGQNLADTDGVAFGPVVTINNINSQNLRLTLSAGIPGTIGRDHSLVYAANDTGDVYTGVMHIRNIISTTQLEVEMTKGSVGLNAGFLRLANPVLPAVASRTISTISTNHTRYIALKGFGFKVLPFLESGSSASVYEISPSLPPGLTFSATTGEIGGIPTDRADQTTYTITVSNEFENPTYTPKTYNIILEVKDYLALFNKTENAGSYILHKAGMGNGREPCMITREQFESDDAGQRDISCFLEAGELDLYHKGINVDFSLGNDMCQFYRLDPYFFARFEVPDTTDNLDPNTIPEIHTGEIANPLCNAAQPFVTVTADSNLATPAQQRCDYDYGTQLDWLSGGFNCDVRTLRIRTRNYSLIEVCSLDNTILYDTETCGTCSAGGFTTSTSCTGATETWTPAASQTACRDTVQGIADHSCGGEVEACMAGAGTEIGDKGDLFNLNTAILSNAEGLEKVNTTFTAPRDLDFFTNKQIANFKNINTCTSTKYAFNYSTLETNFRTKRNTAVASELLLTPFVGNPFYSYLCLDSGNNIQARIRLVVREWNQSFRASDNIDMINPDGEFAAFNTQRKMDLYLDGSSDPILNGFGEAINRYLDWEQSEFDGGACNVVNATGFPDGEEDL